jgi:type IV secretion system protein VirB4
MIPARTNRWFTDAHAANSIMPVSRFVGPAVFATKTGGYGCLFELSGVDEEGLTDQELEAKIQAVEGGLRGLPEGSCLYQYMRIKSGFDIPRKRRYADPMTQSFVEDRLSFLDKTAKFRRIDLHWCLTFEPKRPSPFKAKPKEQANDNGRLLAELQKAASILEAHLGPAIGLHLMEKEPSFQFFAELFNLEEWAGKTRLQTDTGVDRQIAASPVS